MGPRILPWYWYVKIEIIASNTGWCTLSAKLKPLHQILVNVLYRLIFFSEFVSVGPVEKHVGRWRWRVYTHRSGLCCWGFYTAYSPTSYRYRSKHFLGSTLKFFSKAVFRICEIDIDPDPLICTIGFLVCILLFSSVAFEVSQKIRGFTSIFLLITYVVIITSVFKDN